MDIKRKRASYGQGQAAGDYSDFVQRSGDWQYGADCSSNDIANEAEEEDMKFGVPREHLHFDPEDEPMLGSHPPDEPMLGSHPKDEPMLGGHKQKSEPKKNPEEQDGLDKVRKVLSGKGGPTWEDIVHEITSQKGGK